MQCSLPTMQVLLHLLFFITVLLLCFSVPAAICLIVASHNSFESEPKKMGQSLKKSAPEIDEKGRQIDELYDQYFTDKQQPNFTDFYRQLCGIVEELNHKRGHTQFKVPKVETLRSAFNKHHTDKGKPLTKPEFQNIMKEVIADTGFTGLGIKDSLLYVFGVPVTALLLKQRVMPQAIPNEFFIPGVTSITVLILATLNKI